MVLHIVDKCLLSILCCFFWKDMFTSKKIMLFLVSVHSYCL